MSRTRILEDEITTLRAKVKRIKKKLRKIRTENNNLKKGIYWSYKENGWSEVGDTPQDVLDYVLTYCDEFYPDIELT